MTTQTTYRIERLDRDGAITQTIEHLQQKPITREMADAYLDLARIVMADEHQAGDMQWRVVENITVVDKLERWKRGQFKPVSGIDLAEILTALADEVREVGVLPGVIFNVEFHVSNYPEDAAANRAGVDEIAAAIGLVATQEAHYGTPHVNGGVKVVTCSKEPEPPAEAVAAAILTPDSPELPEEPFAGPSPELVAEVAKEDAACECGHVADDHTKQGDCMRGGCECVDSPTRRAGVSLGFFDDPDEDDEDDDEPLIPAMRLDELEQICQDAREAAVVPAAPAALDAERAELAASDEVPPEMRAALLDPSPLNIAAALIAYGADKGAATIAAEHAAPAAISDERVEEIRRGANMRYFGDTPNEDGAWIRTLPEFDPTSVYGDSNGFSSFRLIDGTTFHFSRPMLEWEVSAR